MQIIKMNAAIHKETMMKTSKSPAYFAFLAAGSFLMAAISFSGVLLFKEDLIGRLITGSVWRLVTLGWLGEFFHVRIKQKAQS